MRPWRRPSLRAWFAGLAWLLVAAFAVQLVLAGLAVMHDPGYLDAHRTWGSALELVAIALVVLAAVGGAARWTTWTAAALFLLFWVQHALIGAAPTWLKAAHPLLAVGMVAMAALLAAATTPSVASRLARAL